MLKLHLFEVSDFVQTGHPFGQRRRCQGCHLFASAFCRALGFGGLVQRAIDEAKLELMLPGIHEKEAPRVRSLEKNVDAERIQMAVQRC